MKVKGDWLKDPRTVRVFDAFDASGHSIFFVGGAVRNAALGLPVSDIDLATPALPEQSLSCAEGAGLKVVPTGLSHGTVTVVSGGLAHEITTFRKDIDTDGRRAVVAFTNSMEDDAARRDFTINALYADRSGNVFDPTGGLADIDSRVIRFVGNPIERVREDYLRILRFFRMHAWFADPSAGIDPDGLAAVAEEAEGLDDLPAERIGHEMLRLLAAADPAPALAAMAQSGVLWRVLPGASAENVARLIHFESGATPDAIRRLAALGGEEARDRFRLSRKEARALDALEKNVSGGQGLAELAFRHGAAHATDVLFLRAAAFEQPPLANAGLEIAKGAAAQFPVSPKDLMPDYAGEALGLKLDELKDRWIKSDFTLSRKELLAWG